MPISLIPLPYAEDALAPGISADTLAIHHGKHHQAYVDKTNEAVAGTALADSPLEAIVVAARLDDQKLFNNAAQAWNHGFYWLSLSPEPTSPSGGLATAIDRDFGSLARLKAELAARGAAHFASGWVWLASDNGTLSIEETHDGDTLADRGKLPLLTIDLWEHAYYLDRKSERPKYLAAVTTDLLDWEFAAANLARAERWIYPG
ncbi:MAG TPA: superoxide dismutase [Novosphingobium sp.]|nr:superoxide dismutase [Novosphingobium sp.]